MAKKFYAVRKGEVPGIYVTWAECLLQVNGFSNAEYKSFTSLDEAEAYMEGNVQKPTIKKIIDTEAVAYVDGSYNKETNQFSYGAVIFCHGKEQHFSEVFDDPELAEMNNVAGELKGAEKAIQFCLDNSIKSLTIYHDYEGIAKWCTGRWKANKIGTKAYKAFYDSASTKVKIQFVKVKGHSGDKYNDLADKLARNAFHENTFSDHASKVDFT
jgi:ribonuclease HI